jgi:hypothetical protein
MKRKTIRKTYRTTRSVRGRFRLVTGGSSGFSLSCVRRIFAFVINDAGLVNTSARLRYNLVTRGHCISSIMFVLESLESLSSTKQDILELALLERNRVPVQGLNIGTLRTRD